MRPVGSGHTFGLQAHPRWDLRDRIAVLVPKIVLNLRFHVPNPLASLSVRTNDYG